MRIGVKEPPAILLKFGCLLGANIDPHDPYDWRMAWMSRDNNFPKKKHLCITKVGPKTTYKWCEITKPYKWQKING